MRVGGAALRLAVIVRAFTLAFVTETYVVGRVTWPQGSICSAPARERLRAHRIGEDRLSRQRRADGAVAAPLRIGHGAPDGARSVPAQVGVNAGIRWREDRSRRAGPDG